MEVDSAAINQFGNEFSTERQASKRMALLVVAGLSVIFIVSAILKPSTGEYFTVCGFKNFTGLPCPGCGLTHSFCALTKGDLSSAFAFNLLGPALFLVLICVWVRSIGVLFDASYIVRALDGLAKRLNLVRLFVFGFGIYGVVRIAYVLFYSPANYQDNPLAKLIARFIH
jgi:uncharacterized protein DUF2752